VSTYDHPVQGLVWMTSRSSPGMATSTSFIRSKGRRRTLIAQLRPSRS
jgi:hypothetical protein